MCVDVANLLSLLEGECSITPDSLLTSLLTSQCEQSETCVSECPSHCLSQQACVSRHQPSPLLLELRQRWAAVEEGHLKSL